MDGPFRRVESQAGGSDHFSCRRIPDINLCGCSGWDSISIVLNVQPVSNWDCGIVGDLKATVTNVSDGVSHLLSVCGLYADRKSTFACASRINDKVVIVTNNARLSTTVPTLRLS